MSIRKSLSILFLFSCFLLVDCRDLRFERNVIESLESGDYQFIIDNSVTVIAENFLLVQQIGYKEISGQLRVIKAEKLYKDAYQIQLVTEDKSIMIMQYQKLNGKNTISEFYGERYFE